MAYNKSKFVEAAQKLLNQGKVAQAIAEYQQILKYEPRDQVTLMTIGELYIRQGETFQAIDYFERLAQLFVSDGFLTKAIAVYKRIAKLAPEEIRPLEKLADLYVQQGVMSEARPLFLQLAELHLKNNKQPEAVALLKKLLLAEPDNLRIQVRLADLYAGHGAIRRSAGSAMFPRRSGHWLAATRQECEKLADKALHINPKNLDALIVKARVVLLRRQSHPGGADSGACARPGKGWRACRTVAGPVPEERQVGRSHRAWPARSSPPTKRISAATQKVTQALLEVRPRRARHVAAFAHPHPHD